MLPTEFDFIIKSNYLLIPLNSVCFFQGTRPTESISLSCKDCYSLMAKMYNLIIMRQFKGGNIFSLLEQYSNTQLNAIRAECSPIMCKYETTLLQLHRILKNSHNLTDGNRVRYMKMLLLLKTLYNTHLSDMEQDEVYFTKNSCNAENYSSSCLLHEIIHLSILRYAKSDAYDNSIMEYYCGDINTNYGDGLIYSQHTFNAKLFYENLLRENLRLSTSIAESI